MAWNGSGTFSRTNGTHTGSSTWVQDRDAGDYILASRHDTHDQDLADGIGACLTKNNETKPTAHFRPNADASYDLGSAALQWKNAYLSGKILAGNGTAAAPSYSFGSTGNDDNGMYLYGSEKLGWSIAGSAKMVLSATGLGIGGVPTQAFDVVSGSIYAQSGGLWSYGASLTDTAGGNSKAELMLGNKTSGYVVSHRINNSNEAVWDLYNGSSWSNIAKLTSSGLTIVGTTSSIPFAAFSSTPVTMTAGYSNTSLVAAKDALGVVHLRGVANKDAAAAGALTYCTLASGYRPAITRNVYIFNAVDGAVRCQVLTSGSVIVTHASSNNGNTSFDFSFPTT